MANMESEAYYNVLRESLDPKAREIYFNGSWDLSQQSPKDDDLEQAPELFGALRAVNAVLPVGTV